MDIRTFTAEQLVSNIRLILKDSSFKSRLEKASKIFASDRQLPSERAAFWIEHVCQFGGEHLLSGGSHLSEFEYFMGDVMTVVLLIGVAAIVCFYLSAITCYRLLTKAKIHLEKLKAN